MDTEYIFEDISRLDVRLEEFDAESTDLVFEYTTERDETVSVELEDIAVDEIAEILDPDSVKGHKKGIDFFESPRGRETGDETSYNLAVHSGRDVISVSGLKKEHFLAGYTRPDSFYDRTGRD
ncbi:MAG: hypothetical protein ABEJ69_02530, partial [Candidatus Nanohaloarchaea archaeon]